MTPEKQMCEKIFAGKKISVRFLINSKKTLFEVLKTEQAKQNHFEYVYLKQL